MYKYKRTYAHAHIYVCVYVDGIICVYVRVCL